jgi:hypothetical protein
MSRGWKRVAACTAVALAVAVVAGASESIRDAVKADCANVPDDNIELYRQQAFERMRSRGEPGQAALLDLAKSKGPIRSCAIDHLYRLRDKRVLREPRADEESVAVAARCVGALGDQKELDAVLELFRSQRAVLGALDALVSFNGDRARRLVREALNDPRYAADIYAIIDALGRMRDVGAMPLLVELEAHGGAKGRSEDLVRCLVAEPLARIGTPESRRMAVEIVARSQKGILGYDASSHVVRALAEQRKASQDEAERTELTMLIEQMKPYFSSSKDSQ